MWTWAVSAPFVKRLSLLHCIVLPLCQRSVVYIYLGLFLYSVPLIYSSIISSQYHSVLILLYSNLNSDNVSPPIVFLQCSIGSGFFVSLHWTFRNSLSVSTKQLTGIMIRTARESGILTVSHLPIHNHGSSFHLFSPLIPSIRIL